MGLFATNFGEAWRMAVGADASAKMLSFFSTLPVALASWWPSLHPLDLLVGLCCGAGLRLAVYLKSKNAKKYRHGMEYGSARWGTHEDIAPYIDPVFQNNVILTKTESLTMNSRPKDPKTARNKNVLVIGGSGSGKTRFWLKPNLMQMHSSYVVTDPKGTILVECGKMLQRGTPKLGKDGKPMKDKRGKVIYEPYRIKVLNTINFKKSMHYNPFAYIHSEKDILKLVTTLIANTKGEGKAGDDFWVKAETLLYCALIGYIHYEAPVEEQNFSTLIEFINAMEVREDDEEFKNPVDLMFDALEAENTMSSCSMMAQSIGSVVSGTTYPSDDPELVAVEADYAAKEAALQAEIDNIESSHPGYDEYRYDLDMIGHDPHELAAYLSAVLQGYTRQSAQAELERVFDAQYELTLTEEVEIRYRTETSTDPVTGETTTEEVPYEYYILNVKLTSKPISSVASELLTPDQLEMYQVYRQTLGNKPLIFGGGSPDMSNSEDLTGVVFVNGTRPGNQAVVDIAKSQVGNVGGQPYWSWYGFSSRVEWCACFVSWCYGQMGLSEPRFAACQSQGVPWFQSHGQWGGRDYANIAPGDAIFFDWDLDGSADHVGLVVGTDGSRVYTVEGNSGDACKIKSYSLTYECIKGYGLMNW
ncbi:type IV secretory system conjugative DNA transfer family protein [Ruminococcus bromii]|uniref:CD1108 family mobile element protein n=1 Tax=Ruminococcus bromii TaxID=40518 RepID=UPI003977CC41|nr:type IV secretory system conjugative DNA transfer family protein [Ruminococcus bromii]